MEANQEKRENVLIVSDINIDSGFGKEHFVYNFAKELLIRYNVTIFESSAGRQRKNYNDELIKLGAEISFYNSIFGSLLPYTVKSMKGLFKLLRAADYVYLAESNIFTDLLLIMFRKSTVYKVFRGYHNPLQYDLMPDGRRISRLSPRRLYYRLILRIEREFDGVHVENSEHETLLRDLGYTKIVKIHPYVLNSLSSVPVKKFDNFSLLFLGRLNYHKGSDLIPQIITSLESQGIKFIAYVAGEGILSPHIRDFCDRRQDCAFLGYLDSVKKQEFLSKSHVLIAPTRVEAFMLTGIESMASGTPVISFSVPGPSDYIKDGVNGYIVRDVGDLVERIKILYSDFVDKTYDKYTENCLKTASDYTLDAGKGEYLRIIGDLLNSY